ncbi:MAG: hypothetical protein FJ351_03790 [Sphingomonadales bacterium]|nr:hypothetical protein [Sphingomonadales bacterium]
MRKGSKVVCVDDRFPPELFIYYTQLPLKDRTYTVRDMGVGISHKGEVGEVVVYLVELTNPASSKPPHPERGFAQWRFREIEPPVESEEVEVLEQVG